MPPKVEDLAVLRVVVREGFSRDLAGMLLADLRKAIDHFEPQSARPGKKPVSQFAH
jgi:glutamate decarboxylase